MNDKTQMQTVTIDNGAVRYTHREGTGGKSLLFVHGFASGGFIWQDFLQRVPAEHHVWVIDLPGNGGSDMPAEPPTLEYYSKIIEQFRSRIIQGSFVGIGHSMGAAILGTYAARNEFAEKLMFVSPADDEADPGPMWKFLKTPGVGRLVLQFYPPSLSSMHKRVQRGAYDRSVVTEELSRQYYELFTQGHARDWIPQALRIERSRVPWNEIRVPTSVIYGEQDSMISERFIERLRSSIPHVSVLSLPRCRHIPHLEHPELVAKELKKLL